MAPSQSTAQTDLLWRDAGPADVAGMRAFEFGIVEDQRELLAAGESEREIDHRILERNMQPRNGRVTGLGPLAGDEHAICDGIGFLAHLPGVTHLQSRESSLTSNLPRRAMTVASSFPSALSPAAPCAGRRQCGHDGPYERNHQREANAIAHVSTARKTSSLSAAKRRCSWKAICFKAECRSEHGSGRGQSRTLAPRRRADTTRPPTPRRETGGAARPGIALRKADGVERSCGLRGSTDGDARSAPVASARRDNGKTEPTRTMVPPRQISGHAPSNACGEPESSRTASAPWPSVVAAMVVARASGAIACVAPNVERAGASSGMHVDANHFSRAMAAGHRAGGQPEQSGAENADGSIPHVAGRFEGRHDRSRRTTGRAGGRQRELVGQLHDGRSRHQQAMFGQPAQ